MTNADSLVQRHYGRSDLLARIEARLRAANVDPLKPRAEDLHPFDQLHGHGIMGTKEHATRARLRAGMHCARPWMWSRRFFTALSGGVRLPRERYRSHSGIC
jgi:hypothetical protein